MGSEIITIAMKVRCFVQASRKKKQGKEKVNTRNLGSRKIISQADFPSSIFPCPYQYNYCKYPLCNISQSKFSNSNMYQFLFSLNFIYSLDFQEMYYMKNIWIRKQVILSLRHLSLGHNKITKFTYFNAWKMTSKQHKPASLKLETFSRVPEVSLPLSELLLWHSLFQNEQKLFPHQRVS